MSTFADAIARIRIATWAEDDETVAGLREAALSWGPDAGKVADAALALDRGQTDEAVAFLNQAHILQHEARDEASRLRAEALLEGGRPADALMILEGMPGDGAATSKARALFRLRRADDAVAVLDEVLSRDPDHWEARLGRAVLHLSQGQVEAAMPMLEKLRGDQPLDPRPYRALAKVFLLTGDAVKGASFLELLLENQLIASPAIAIDLAELYAVSGQTDRLPTVLESVTRAAKVGTKQAIELARLWQEVPSSGAIRHLAQAMGERPVSALLNALAVEVEGGDALEAFQAVSGVDHWLVHERLAAHLLAAERPDDAEPHVAQAQKMAPRTAAVRITVAVAALHTDASTATDQLRAAAAHPSLRASERRRAQRALAAIDAVH